MLGSLATTSALCWLTNARLVRKLHGSIYLSFTWLKFITDYWPSWIYTKRAVIGHLTIITVSKYYRFQYKNFLGNHKCTIMHYIIQLSIPPHTTISWSNKRLWKQPALIVALKLSMFNVYHTAEHLIFGVFLNRFTTKQQFPVAWYSTDALFIILILFHYQNTIENIAICVTSISVI